MQAMLARVSSPIPYQAFQHFVTHAPWDARPVWRRLLEVLPERSGILIVDDTGFPKQGRQSVGVTRQYCGALGKVANCQVAVTVALWNGLRAWLLGAELYLPEEWLQVERRLRAQIPDRVTFQEKWRLALSLVRRAVGAGIQVEAVVADAGYGDVTAFRDGLERMGLAYALGVSSTTTVFRGEPRTVAPPRQPRGGRPRTRPVLDGRVRTVSLRQLIRRLPASTWKRVTWRNGANRPWSAEFVALRVTPAHDWRHGRPATAVWLLAERAVDGRRPTKFFLSNLPHTATLRQLVRLAHQRWAIEQQYQNLKTELGMDHFEGRTYPGWNHHLVLCAMAYAFLQKERKHRRAGPNLTFPAVHAVVQAVFAGLIMAARPQYLDWLNKAKEFL